jgi:hypothetical protein
MGEIPLLAKVNANKHDALIHHHYLDGLLTELVSLLGSDDRSVDYKNFRNGKCYRLVNVPKHENGTICFKLPYLKNNMWVESMLDFFAGDKCERNHAAKWMAMYFARYYKEEASSVATKLSMVPNKNMDAVSFQAMETAINANI